MNTHDAWEEIHRTKNWGTYPSEHIIRFVARNYYSKERNKVKILDFGCGTGANTWYLAREGFDTYAFDISETAIQKLMSLLREEHLTAHVDVQDGLKLRYENDLFDAVIDNVSIQSNIKKDIKTMYENVYHVLKPRGKMISVVFDKDTTGYGTGVEVESGTYEGLETGNLQGLGVRHFFTKDELRKMLEDVGFENLCIDINLFTDNGNVVSQLIATGDKRYE